MADERTGLSSHGQQRFDDLELTVRALAAIAGVEAVNTRRDEIARDDRAAEANAAAAALGAPDQVQIDALQAQIRELMARMGPATSPPRSDPPVPAGAFPATAPASQPFEGQTPMVTQPGPTA